MVEISLARFKQMIAGFARIPPSEVDDEHKMSDLLEEGEIEDLVFDLESGCLHKALPLDLGEKFREQTVKGAYDHLLTFL